MCAIRTYLPRVGASSHCNARVRAWWFQSPRHRVGLAPHPRVRSPPCTVTPWAGICSISSEVRTSFSLNDAVVRLMTVIKVPCTTEGTVQGHQRALPWVWATEHHWVTQQGHHRDILQGQELPSAPGPGRSGGLPQKIPPARRPGPRVTPGQAGELRTLAQPRHCLGGCGATSAPAHLPWYLT